MLKPLVRNLKDAPLASVACRSSINATLALVEGGGEDAELSGGGAFLGGQIIHNDQPIDVGGLDKSIDLY